VSLAISRIWPIVNWLNKNTSCPSANANGTKHAQIKLKPCFKLKNGRKVSQFWEGEINQEVVREVEDKQNPHVIT